MTAPNPPPSRWPALAAVNLAAVIFGCNALFGRIDASPVWLVAGRMGFAALALLLIGLARRTLVRPSPRQIAGCALSGVLIALHWITFFASVQAGGVAIATLTVSGFPLFTILLNAARDRKPPQGIEVAASLAIMAAIALIARPRGAPGVVTGAILGLTSAALFSVYSLASERLVRELGPLNLSMLQYALAAMLLAPILPFAKAVAGLDGWLALVALGVFGTALSFQLYLFALGRMPAVVCGGFTCLEPVYAIALAALLFSEPISPLVALSAAIIVGASLVLLSGSKDPPAAEPGVL